MIEFALLIAFAGPSGCAEYAASWRALFQETGVAAVQDSQEEDAILEHEQRRLEHPSEHVDLGGGGALGTLLDLGGLRSGLEDRGVVVALLVSHDLSWTPQGGREPHATAARALGEVEVAMDTGELFSLEGGQLYGALQFIEGENGSLEIGTLQEVTSVDAEERSQLARVWYEQRVGDGFVRAGKMDANSLFAYADNAARFLHSSMGVSPTILGLPTYPDSAFGFALGVPVTSGLETRLGLFDGAAQEGFRTGRRGASTLLGAPSSLFLVAELDGSWTGPHAGRVGVGAWRHTGDFARFDGGQEDGTSGGYLVLDQRLWGDPEGAGPVVGLFGQYGTADSAVTPFHRHVGFGLVAENVFAPGMKDALGLGLATVSLSDDPSATYDTATESALELFYAFEPVPWLRFKPAVQFVDNPGGDASVDDALVLTLRTTLAL